MQVHFTDREEIRREWRDARPFPFAKIDQFLDPCCVAPIVRAYPNFEAAAQAGRVFESINERKKIQVTDSRLFPEPVAQLSRALAAPEFLADLSYISGIPNLLADDQLIGGGMHITGPGGRLDVHIDFNYIKERGLHRRLNLLLYLNQTWEAQWGGHIQLWDPEVKHCAQAFSPVLNRCVIFETSEISYHGVTPVSPKAPFSRHSFATYYYTREAPPNWSGSVHSTIFRARPEERLRRYFFMPAETVQRRVIRGTKKIKRTAKKLIDRIR